MDGVEFSRIIETELANRGIKKGDFYNATGISATALYNWKRGSTPSMESVAAVEDYLGISASNMIRESSPKMDQEVAALLQDISDRQDLRILLRSAKDVPPSSVYALVSQIEKMKENNT